MKFKAIALAAATTWLLTPAAFGQFDQPATPPPQTGPAEEKPIEVLSPTIDKKQNQISLPAAFWNEKLTDWVEVAVCGRPSDFLHETVVSITTTKTKMEDALRTLGFHDADAWVKTVADFPRIRCDRALILLEVTRNNKTETYCLDELLTFQGWNVPLGPFGWMFKGEPDHPTPPSISPSTPPSAQPSATSPDLTPLIPREQILRDDPQVALQFRGIQHLSQSFMDHPLCYDDWIYPNFRYHRNYDLLPTEVYDSNGAVPVRMIIRKVNEADLLKTAAANWHDPAYAKYMLAQMPIAEQIDKDKAALWAILQAKKTTPNAHIDNLPDLIGSSAQGATEPLTLLSIAIEKGYATLDEAWTEWACDHARLDTTEPQQVAEFNDARKLWLRHMTLKRKHSEDIMRAETAAETQRQLAKLPRSAKIDADIRVAKGKEIENRNWALVAENAQVREYWNYEKQRLTADDPRVDWRKHINLQSDLSQAKQDLAEAGVAYGKAMQKGTADAMAQTQKSYQAAVVRAEVLAMKSQLGDLDFEISKREGMEGDPDLATLKKQREALAEEVQAAEAQISGKSGK